MLPSNQVERLLGNNSGLTLSCPEISVTSVVWTYDTYENNLGNDYKLKKYLKRSCWLVSDKDFSFKYFLKTVFVREISTK